MNGDNAFTALGNVSIVAKYVFKRDLHGQIQSLKRNFLLKRKELSRE